MDNLVFRPTICDPVLVHQPEWKPLSLSGSSLAASNENLSNRTATGNRRFTGILDPRSEKMQRWNRIIVLARGLALAVDPLFFFAISISCSERPPCIYMDGGVATIATVIRTCVDLVHTCHLCLQFRLAYVSKESMVVGCGKLVWDARSIASHYVFSLKGFWFDAFVILPIPQAMYWVVVPILLRKNRIGEMMIMLQFIFLVQFLPKVYHAFCVMRAMRKVTGFIFGSVWWLFGLNIIAYFLASHAFGGYWYILGLHRIASCLTQQCNKRGSCSFSLSCAREICCYAFGDQWSNNSTKVDKKPVCLDVDGPFRYGIYQFALPLISRNSVTIKILYSNLWGLMTLSTMGNILEPTSQCLEVIFSICMVVSGLMLFTMLIGNIEVFLNAVMMRRKKMQQRHQDVEWWMKRRQLPSHLRCRVHKYERQRWQIMGGQDEMELIKNLPQGLRLDIKRYLCLDLIEKVPLFYNLDDVILDNICDRVKQLVYSKDEKIIKEGDPVQRMIFIVRGKVKRSQGFKKGTLATSILEPGSFLGDELISWCLRIPFLDWLPASSATFTCTENAEAFALDAVDLRNIIDQFRYYFTNEGIKWKMRYYSSYWRTWAAVNIQLAWRRCVRRTRHSVNYAMKNRGGNSELMLRQYAAVFMSLRPHDHLE